MRQIFGLIMLIAMVAQTFQLAVIEADFVINQQQITEELCVNIDNPEMECHGHCQLKKEMEKKQTPEAADHVRKINLFVGVNDRFQLTQKFATEKSSYPLLSPARMPQVAITDVFRPPDFSPATV